MASFTEPIRPAKYGDLHDGHCQCMMCINGPGGKTTLIENNEKSILELGLQSVISQHVYADLGSNHDSQRQGIYRSSSIGDRD